MKLKSYRAIANMTQQQLAERLGVSQLSVIKYENGENIPSREQMINIFRVSNGAVTPNDFYDLGIGEPDQLQPPSSLADTSLLAVGLMSGTSMDGINASIIATDGIGYVREIGSHHIRYEPHFKLLLRTTAISITEAFGDLKIANSLLYDVLRQTLKEAPQEEPLDLDKEISNLEEYVHNKRHTKISIPEIIKRSTELHISTAQSLLKELGYKPKSIDVIGYHGQTVFHAPHRGITLQVGDAQLMSNQLSISVVSDFRSEDIKHGGTGAPLAPLFHKALALQSHLLPAAVLNLGGVASLTIINQEEDQLYAFDAGPACILIDRLVFQRIGRAMDQNGSFGIQGKVHLPTLKLLANSAIYKPDGSNYLRQPPPKSLDPSDIRLISELDSLSLNDGCATLAAFTALCVGEGVKTLLRNRTPVPSLWILSGGGARNKAIVSELQKVLIPIIGSHLRIQDAEKVSWNSESLEAQMFGYLAVRRLKGLPTSLPGTTGAKEPVSGGMLSFPDGNRARATKKVRMLIDA
jgi:anhydro-N-acetylmuramic acid kinase